MVKLSWVVADLGGLLCASLGSYFFYFHFIFFNPNPYLRISRGLWGGLFGAVGIAVNYLWELYEPQILADSRKIFQRMAAASLTLGTFIALLNYAVFFPGVGRIILTLSLLVGFLWTLAWRLVRAEVFLLRRRGKVVIVGDGEFVKDLCSVLLNSNHHPFVLKAVARCSGKIEGLDGVPVISVSDVHQAVVEDNVSQIILVPGEKLDGPALDSLTDCLRFGVSFEDGQDFYERLTGRICVSHIDQMRFLSKVRTLGGPVVQGAKRILDFAFALLGFALALPVAALLAILIKLESRGPVLYRQSRVGLNGKVFELIKFRTMQVDAEKDGPVWAAPNDPRMTLIGRVLRRLRLDELPQLWNILVGDMSFVGPRPERPEFVEVLRREIPLYSQRHLVRPGLTGWAQVCYPYGAGVEDARRKLEYDLYYIRHEGLLIDLLVLGRTVSVVLGRMGSR